MADLALLRAGIAANLAVFATADPEVTVSPYQIANPQPPIMWVIPNPEDLVDYHQAMANGLEYWHLMVEAYTGGLDETTGQQLLDVYVQSTGANSVKTAIESDLALGGACQSLQVTTCRRYTTYTRPDGATLVGAQWLVEVLA